MNYIFGPYCHYWGNPEHPKGSVTEQAHGLFKFLMQDGPPFYLKEKQKKAEKEIIK